MSNTHAIFDLVCQKVSLKQPGLKSGLTGDKLNVR